MKYAFLLVLFGLTACQAGDDFALVRVGDSWHYRPGTNEPPAGWQDLDFDAGDWAEGHSGFGFTGSSATLIGTLGQEFSSIYFRCNFDVSDLNSIQWLIFRLDYLDGWVAYLNGEEVGRRGLPGLPGSFVPYRAVPLSRTSGVPEEIDLSAYKHLLRKGRNVLAIQSHMTFPFHYGYTLVPELLVNFVRGPFLQNLSSNRVQVVWKTPYPSDTSVQYQNSRTAHHYHDTNLTLLHVASLSGLASDTEYTYTVASSKAGQTAVSPPIRFRTFRSQGTISFSVIGDTGYGSLGQIQMAHVLRRTQSDLVIHLGDVLYPAFTQNLADLRCFSVYQPQMKTTPFFMTVGNHDLMNNVTDYLDAFYLPTNNPAGTEFYYSFDHGEVHFTVLNAILHPPVGDYSPGSPQLLWLERDLAETHKPWKFLFLHTPPRSSGPHRIDDYNANQVLDSIGMDTNICELARRYGVQIIFAGHDHAYERLRPVGGVYGIVSGGGGSVLYSSAGLWNEASAQRYARYHCVKVQVSRESLRLEAIGSDDQVFDTLDLRRTPLPQPVFQAQRHSPRVEDLPANDDDGNIIGQAFDLIGEPVPALLGRDSHLGNLHVNYDEERLYLGLRGVMIGASQTILMFIEVPRKTGLRQLADLPSFTEGFSWMRLPLAFAHWTPSMVGVLGDEFQDGQYGSPFRTNAALGDWQGVFFLENGFPPVPGVCLQQFNQSPQMESVTGDSQPDYVELSVPCAQLGRLLPGEKIKVGVVVVTNRVARISPETPSPRLDSSFIGRSLIAATSGQWLLEGVSVDLSDPDTDQDGVSDHKEQIAGTDPENPLSLLKMEIRPLFDTQLQIRWQAVPGRKYQIEYQTGAAAAFQPVQHSTLPRLASAPLEEFIAPPSHLTNQSRFFRIRLME